MVDVFGKRIVYAPPLRRRPLLVEPEALVMMTKGA